MSAASTVRPGPVYADAALPGPIIPGPKPMLCVFEADRACTWQSLAEQAKALVVTDEASLRAAEAVLVQLHQAAKDMESRRTELKKPVTQLGRAIDQVVAGVAEPVDQAKRTLQGRIQAWVRAEQAKVEEARRRAEEEARRVREAAEAERRRMEAEAKAKADAEAAEFEALFGTPAPAEVATPAPVTAPEPPRAIAPVKAAPVSAAVQTRKVHKLVIDNPRSIPFEVGGRILVRFDEAAIKALLLVGIQVPGCRLVEEEVVAMRGGRS